MNKLTPAILVVLLLLGCTSAETPGPVEPPKEVNMKSLTPVLLVEEIEPCLDFWFRLGFEKTIEVPEGDKLGFVALSNGPVEVMLQSRASVTKDVEALSKGPFAKDGFGLYIKVANLDEIIAKLGDAEVVVPKRTTFYGANEIGVRSPSGAHVMFAEFAEQQ